MVFSPRFFLTGDGFPPRLATLAVACLVGFAITPARSSEALDDSADEPLALLQRQCVRCHTEDKRKGGLIMTSREAIFKGGDSGPAAQSGQSGGSLLIETLFPDADPHMPPKGQLSPVEIMRLEEWIDEGLPWDDALWERLQSTPLTGPVTLTALPDSYRPIFGLALAPDGRTLAVGRGHLIEWLEIAPQDEKSEGTPSFTPRAPSEPGLDAIQSLAWSPDGKTLAVGGFRRITLWDATTREMRGEITDSLAGRISALAFTPDSKLLLAADSVDSASGRLLNIDPAKAAIERSESAHGDSIFAIAVSGDGRLAATVSADKSAKVWSLADGKPIHHLEGHTDYVLAAAFSPTADRLATAGDDEEIKIWNLGTGKKVSSFGGTRTGAITALAWSTDPEKAKRKADEKDAAKAAEINADFIVSINDVGQPRLYTDLNEHEGEQRSTGAKEKSADASEKQLTSLVFDPGSRRFFAGATTGQLFAWEATGKLLAQWPKENAIAQANP